MPGVLKLIAEFAGVVVGEELRHTRAMGPAIAAIDWSVHDGFIPDYDTDAYPESDY